MPEYSPAELVQKWEEFFDQSGYAGPILSVADAYPETRTLEVTFDELNRFDTDFAIHFLRNPQTSLVAGEEAITRIAPPGDQPIHVHLRVKGLPRDIRIMVRDLRAEHLGRFVTVDGLVRKATEVRPKVVDATFKCLRCNQIIKEPQEGTQFREPMECYPDQGGCGRTAASTKFKLLGEASQYLDTQKIEIQEPPEILRGGQEPQRLEAYLEDDITGQITPGERVVLSGVLRSAQRGRPGQKSTIFDIFVDINSVEKERVEFEDLNITPEDVRLIRDEAARPNIVGRIVQSISPTLYGLEMEKEALALQLFGGVAKRMPDGTRIRGDIHALLIGDPGAGKCVAGETLVLLSDGTRAFARDIAEDVLRAASANGTVGKTDDGVYALTNHDLIALSLEGKAASAKMNVVWKRRAPDRMLRFSTTSGRRIIVTPTHPFFTWARGVRARPASELRSGEFLATPRTLPVKGRPQPLDGVRVRKSLANNARRLVVPKSTNPRFWRFIGLLVGDGHVQLGPANGTTFFTNNEDALLEEVRAFAVSLGLAPSLRAPHRGKTAKEVVIPGIEPASFLFALGAAGPSPERTVPDLLFKCSPREISAFIGGLFDAEGSVSTTRREIEIASASQRLLLDVQHLLLRLGILGRVRSRKHANGKTYYRLSAAGLSALRFAERITVRHPSKVLLLSALRARSESLNSNVDVVPLRPDELRFLRTALRLRQGDMGVTRSACLHYEAGGEHPSVEAIARIARAARARLRELQDMRNRLASKPPTVWREITVLRQRLHLSQAEMARRMGVSQSLVSLYDRGVLRGRALETNLARAARTLREVLTQALGSLAAADVATLELAAASDIFWDRIESIEEIAPPEPYVYDLQVPHLHNFIANDFVVHNSQLLQYMSTIAPRAMFVSGKGTSAAGLLAAAVKDDFGEGRWTLEAGALVLADRGLACIDEIEKMSPQDRGSLHVAMEEQMVHIAKAGITATLPSRCAVLAAANPKFGRFIPEKYIGEQFNLEPALLSRFDVIFPVQDIPQAERDRRMADHILHAHRLGEIRRTIEELGEVPATDEPASAYTPYFAPEFLRKYVAYAKRIYPVMTPDAMDRIRDHYLDIRKQGEAPGASVPITPRQLEAYVRLSEASARARLSLLVDVEDADRAVGIIEYWLRRVASEGGTGPLDIDIVTTGVPASQREQIVLLRDIIAELGGTEMGEGANHEDILEIAERRGIPRDRADAWLRKWKNEGDLYSPVEGRYRLITRL